MARLANCLLLILLAPLVGAVTDPAGDTSARVGGEPVSAPAIDLRNVTGALVDGVLSLQLETWGDLMIGSQAQQQDPDREYTYLFIVAFGIDPDDNLYDHVSSGGDSLTAICTYHEGFFDLACNVTQGDGVLRGAGATGRNVTSRFEVAYEGRFAVGGSSHVSIPNGTTRDIIAQDFTANALPYQGPPGGPEVGQVSEPAEAGPWWRSTWAIVLAIGVAIFIVAMAVPWAWFRPSHWMKRP